MNSLHDKLLALAKHWRERARCLERSVERDAPNEDDPLAAFARELRLSLLEAMRQHADQIERLVALDQAEHQVNTEQTHARIAQRDPQPEVRRHCTSEDDDAPIV